MRNKYVVRYDKKSDKWVVHCPPGTPIGEEDTKAVAVATACKVARADWEQNGQRGTVKIYKKNGQIQEERTYGFDPRRHLG